MWQIVDKWVLTFCQGRKRQLLVHKTIRLFLLADTAHVGDQGLQITSLLLNHLLFEEKEDEIRQSLQLECCAGLASEGQYVYAFKPTQIELGPATLSCAKRIISGIVQDLTGPAEPWRSSSNDKFPSL